MGRQILVTTRIPKESLEKLNGKESLGARFFSTERPEMPWQIRKFDSNVTRTERATA